MIDDMSRTWQSFFSDPTVIGGAIAGLISALVMFIVGEVIWRSFIGRFQQRRELRQKQLDHFYAPLYQFYRVSYARFDDWRSHNPQTQLVRQPFFESDEDEAFVENIFAEHPGYASQRILRLWSDFKSTDETAERNKRRQQMITALIKEYQALRRQLDLDHDAVELRTGEFSTSD